MAEAKIPVDKSQYLVTEYDTPQPDQSGTYLNYPNDAEYAVPADDDAAAEVRDNRRGTVEERNARRAAARSTESRKASQAAKSKTSK
jgi:hypothetical protein